MGKRGPKSEKERAMLSLVAASIERPEPPKGMSKRAIVTWKAITGSLPPGYFRKGAIPLLRAYCEAEALHYEASRIIDETGLFIELEDGSMKPNPAISIQTAKSNEMSTLSTKLRLSVNSYRDRDAAGADGREKPQGKRAGLMFGE